MTSQLWYKTPKPLRKGGKHFNQLPTLFLHFHPSVYGASFKQKTHKLIKTWSKPFRPSLFLLYLLLPFSYLPLLSRHNQRSLEVQKDPDHKNRCRVRFPEVFSSFPYKVNVTSVNALGKASTTISFEESSIGKIKIVSCFLWVVSCCFLLCYTIVLSCLWGGGCCVLTLISR